MQTKLLAQTTEQLNVAVLCSATLTLGITCALPTIIHSQEALETIRMLTSGT